jgi:hypothetical protein
VKPPPQRYQPHQPHMAAPHPLPLQPPALRKRRSTSHLSPRPSLPRPLEALECQCIPVATSPSFARCHLKVFARGCCAHCEFVLYSQLLVPTSGSSGAGSYGEMHRVTSKCGAHGIMKVPVHQPLSLCDHSDFVNEAISLSRLQHPCLTALLSCGLNPLNVVWDACLGCSAMEHMDGCAARPALHVHTRNARARAGSWRAALMTPTKPSPLAWSGKPRSTAV